MFEQSFFSKNIFHKKKPIVYLLPLVFLLSALNIIGWQIAIALAIFCIFYVTLNQSAWWLVVLAPLGLLLGTILHLEIRPNWIYEISLGEIFIMAAFLSLVFDTIFGLRPQGIKIPSTGWWLIGYSLLALVSVFYVYDYELFVAGMKVLVVSIVSYLSVVNLLDNQHKIKALITSLTIFAGVLALQVLFLLFQSGFSPAIFFDRSSITFPFGALALVVAIIAFLLPLIFSQVIESTKGSKLFGLSLIVFGLGSIAVFVSLGKAAILSLMIGLIILFWRFRRQRIIMSLLVSFFILISLVFFSSYVESFWQRFAGLSLDNTTSFRLEEYKAARYIITNHPWLGLGIGEQLNEYRRLLHPDYGELANNYILQATMDLGIIGVLLYLGVLFSIVASVFKLNKKVVTPLVFGLTAGIVVALINGLFEVTMFAFQYAIIFWLIVGLIYRIGLNNKIYESAA